MGGGRYDGLVSRFSDQAIPSTGMSIGLDRLLAALGHMGLIAKPRTLVQVLVVSIGGVPESETLRLASELRAAGFCVEAYFGKKMNLKSQLSHADHYEIPVAVIVGGDELEKGVVSVKDLLEGKRKRESIEDREAYRQAGKTGQVTVPRAQMVSVVKELLGT
jgi:histidyl-tRNA synthetase